MLEKIGLIGGGYIGGVLLQECATRRLARSVGFVDPAPIPNPDDPPEKQEVAMPQIKKVPRHHPAAFPYIGINKIRRFGAHEGPADNHVRVSAFFEKQSRLRMPSIHEDHTSVHSVGRSQKRVRLVRVHKIQEKIIAVLLGGRGHIAGEFEKKQLR